MYTRFPVFLFFFSLIMAITTSAQDHKAQLINRLFGSDGEIYFTFHCSDKHEIDRLTKIISIDKVSNGEVYAYANRTEFSEFIDQGYEYSALTHPGRLLDESELGRYEPDDGTVTIWNFYPSYDQYVDFMYQFAADYPAICKLINIGVSVQGRQLLGLKISDVVEEEEAEPQMLYTSTIHGDETTGYVLMLHLIDYLLTNYGNDPRITQMIDTTEIFINPLANPDGTYHGGNNSVNLAQRYNANNVDLNRNFPDPADGPHPDGNPWQVETEAFMAFADSNHFVISANFHGGEEVFNYPWDTWQRLAADDTWWQFVGHEYVDTVHVYSPGTYFSGFDNGITNGYAWYRITGGRQDYMNYWHYCREVTLEISDIKLLPASQLLNHWEYNYRSLLNFIDQANYGVQGLITDSVTGEPLEAKVFIFGHDQDKSFVYSKLPTGYYSRLLYEGSYTLSYSCEGYYSKSVSDVQVFNRERTGVNVQLVPLGYSSQERKTQRVHMIFPNPNDGTFRMMIPDLSASLVTIECFNSIGQKVYSNTARLNTGQPSITIQLGNQPSGMYIVRLTTSCGLFEERFLIE